MQGLHSFLLGSPASPCTECQLQLSLQHAHMVFGAHMHSPTWAEPNAINSINMCTAMHMCTQVDFYHLCTDHPYKYINSRLDANILQFFTQGTTPAKVNT